MRQNILNFSTNVIKLAQTYMFVQLIGKKSLVFARKSMTKIEFTSELEHEKQWLHCGQAQLIYCHVIWCHDKCLSTVFQQKYLLIFGQYVYLIKYVLLEVSFNRHIWAHTPSSLLNYFNLYKMKFNFLMNSLVWGISLGSAKLFG